MANTPAPPPLAMNFAGAVTGAAPTGGPPLAPHVPVAQFEILLGNRVSFHVWTNRFTPGNRIADPAANDADYAGDRFQIIFSFDDTKPGRTIYDDGREKRQQPANFGNAIRPDLNFNAQVEAIRRWVYNWETNVPDISKEPNDTIRRGWEGRVNGGGPRLPEHVQTHENSNSPYKVGNARPVNQVWVRAPYHRSYTDEAAHITIGAATNHLVSGFLGVFHIYMNNPTGHYQGYRYTSDSKVYVVPRRANDANGNPVLMRVGATAAHIDAASLPARQRRFPVRDQRMLVPGDRDPPAPPADDDDDDDDNDDDQNPDGGAAGAGADTAAPPANVAPAPVWAPVRGAWVNGPPSFQRSVAFAWQFGRLLALFWIVSPLIRVYLRQWAARPVGMATYDANNNISLIPYNPYTVAMIDGVNYNAPPSISSERVWDAIDATLSNFVAAVVGTLFVDFVRAVSRPGAPRLQIATDDEMNGYDVDM